ncbi:hypothetical protein DPX16_22672 [Anabarilius grahami]|uniref:Uncharacterized protein n=1 Tax=Anabarilius grahami TaxID=495550 RepID=A0A3N0YF12_ANAGA|nr:hypothetical protein DPX16_22672 [Anabarilius grahami]
MSNKITDKECRELVQLKGSADEDKQVLGIRGDGGKTDEGSADSEASPVHFYCPDQRPSAIASDLVSFGGCDEKPLDDSMSLAASDAEEWSGSPHDPATLPSLEPIDARSSIDSELTRVVSKAVEQLGFEWSAPEEPTRSRLDKWFLPGRRQAPPQRPCNTFCQNAPAPLLRAALRRRQLSSHPKTMFLSM